MAVVVAGVVLSLVVVPASLGAALPTLGGTSDATLAFGVVAMAPGFLMGGIGLWLCARG